jgi:leader peptidase (prepilin peptidase)/N-methyltransferase
MGAILAAVVGAVAGSFLNVVIHRVPRGGSVVWPGSACPGCRRGLSWYENIPVVSYLMLRGRCRSCGMTIAARYPIIEILTALMFAAAWWFYGPSPLLVSRLLFGCALIALFAIDLEHQLLPNVITLPGIVVGFLFSFITEPGWVSSLLGILLGGGLLWGMYELWWLIRKEEGLGFGDVKMLAMIGAFLGWKLTLVTLMMGSFAGSILGGALMVAGRGTMKTALPFGTFLALGALLAATFGSPLLDWYLRQW